MVELWLGWGLLMAIPGTAPASDTASVELAKVPFFLGREYQRPPAKLELSCL